MDKLLNTTNEFVNKVKIIDEGATELESKLDGANDIPVKLKKKSAQRSKTPMADPCFSMRRKFCQIPQRNKKKLKTTAKRLLTFRNFRQ
ncbi:MAG: hypothetical protein L6V93_10845 [Clostridiales bacterium]|nr:MAG: hypothetical protein L6V93_10845 [Clostridiales bacterium]